MITYVLYPLIKTRDGRRPGEFPLGTVRFTDKQKIDIDCVDQDIARFLRKHFSTTWHTRRSRGNVASVLTYEWTELYPGSERYFREAVARLHSYDIFPKIVVLLD